MNINPYIFSSEKRKNSELNFRTWNNAYSAHEWVQSLDIVKMNCTVPDRQL